MNKEEALRALEIAKSHLAKGNVNLALKFTKKSLSLHSTIEAEKFLQRITVEEVVEEVKMSSSSSQESIEREYTDDQLQAVKRVNENSEDYYKIFGLSKDATENDIKKAYKKLALSVHPDRNAAPGATEAFKLVSEAFNVLSNEEKRKLYDLYGNSGLNPPFSETGSRQARQRYQNSGFEGEMTPEELFSFIFGQPGGFGVYSSGDFNLGRNGQFNFARHGARRRRQQQQQQRAAQDALPLSSFFSIVQFLPLILFIAVSLFSSLFPSQPQFTFSPTYTTPTMRTTQVRNIPYYVNSADFNYYFGSNSRAIRRYEDSIEGQYIQSLRENCQAEMNRKQAAINSARWWRSNDDLEKANNIRLPSCDQLSKML
jgi:DnaJ family protein B protein 12